MYFKYGSYTHGHGDVAVSSYRIEPLYGPRGFIRGFKRSMTVAGTVIATGQDAIKTAILAVQAAYVDGKDACLYHDDGTKSPHYIPNGGSINGTQVKFEWVDGPGEYATGRSFTATIEAEYNEATDNILEFVETVRVTGNSGPRYAWKQVVNGPPLRQLVQQRTTARASQSGQAVGLNGYPTPPGPLWPQFEHVDQREITAKSPKRNRNGFTEYVTTWTYNFEAGTKLSGLPNQY